MVGAPCRMPRRVKKGVWLGSCRVRAELGKTKTFHPLVSKNIYVIYAQRDKLWNDPKFLSAHSVSTTDVVNKNLLMDKYKNYQFG